MITIPANEPHAVDAVKKFKMMLIMLKSKKNYTREKNYE